MKRIAPITLGLAVVLFLLGLMICCGMIPLKQEGSSGKSKRLDWQKADVEKTKPVSRQAEREISRKMGIEYSEDGFSNMLWSLYKLWFFDPNTKGLKKVCEGVNEKQRYCYSGGRIDRAFYSLSSEIALQNL